MKGDRNMLNTNGEGMAVCRCGSELHVVCSGGCPDPDVVFKSELAAMKKPRGIEPRQEYRDNTPKPLREKKAKYPPPTHCWCGEPVAKRAKFGVGRPPTKCEKHVERKKGVA